MMVIYPLAITPGRVSPEFLCMSPILHAPALLGALDQPAAAPLETTGPAQPTSPALELTTPRRLSCAVLSTGAGRQGRCPVTTKPRGVPYRGLSHGKPVRGAANEGQP